MKHFLIAILIFFISISSLFSVIEETDSFKGFLFGHAPNCEYDNWLSHVAEGIASEGYNLYAPFDRQTNGFGDYKIPSTSDSIAWNNALEFFLAGELDLAQNILNDADIPYEVVIFHDTDYNRTYHILREIPDTSYFDDNGTPNYTEDDEIGAFDYGWGLYVYYPEGPYPHITTAPHPNDDFPSVPMAYKVFVTQKSKFLLISGTGREVKWTHIGYYTNSKSLCDPSRVQKHPFNYAYKKFCNLIRDEFGKREFSIQVHTYDWGNRHAGKANVQISGGSQVINPDLPIRDNSSLKLDIINATNFVVHPANDLGVHPPVYINDFYGVHCTEFPFYYSNEDTTFAVNTDIDLPGYHSNVQMLYTQQGFNHYDNIEPFFHIEMDELPNVYPQFNENYWWFYSWDPVTETFDYDHLYDKFIKYYMPWVNALAQVLQPMFEMNDNQIPVPPSNFRVTGECAQNVTLAWDKGDSYDIYSYEILFANEPITENNYQIIDRTSDFHLASLATTQKILQGLQPANNYYFKIRIKDKNGNYSELSNQIVAFTGAANVTNFKAIGDSTFIKLMWDANYQNNCNGFNIYRKTITTPYQLIASWQSDSTLVGNPEGASYTYYDTTCEQNILYKYKIGFENSDNQINFYQVEKEAVARYVGKIVFVQQIPFAKSDTCYFGYNEKATDSWDSDYDIYNNFSYSSNYFFCQFYEPDWNSHKTMIKEIKGYYDSDNFLKTWNIRFKTDFLNTPVKIKLANYNERNAQRIYLKYSNQWIDIGSGEEFTFTPTNTEYYQFTLYYGNYTPTITFSPISNFLYYPNSSINFQWSINNIFGIDHIDIYAQNKHFLIPIASNLPSNTNQYSWLVPSLIADSLHLKLNLITTQEDTIQYFSSYKFGIIYPQIPITISEGWSLITKNFDTNSATTQQIYGDGTEFFFLNQNQFEEINNPEFTLPYWIYAPEDHTFNILDPDLLCSGFQYNLNQGWNIIPNPYKINFSIDQLIFDLNGQMLQYYQAVNMKLIEPFTFAYNNCFEPTTFLKAGKSYYLYSYYNNITLNYIPYFSPSTNIETSYDWFIKLKVSYENNPNTSKISIIGTNDISNSDVYHPIFDILKPTLKPFENSPTIVLKKDFGDGEKEFYQLADKYEPALETVETIFNAQIRLNSTDQLRFDIDTSNFPPDYITYLYFNGDFKEISPSNPIFYNPDSLITDFQIYITNFEHLNNNNSVLSSHIKTYNYPNPFNPSTTIHFYNEEPNILTTLQIFNLKGQLVKTLINKKLLKGEHEIIWNGKNENNKKVSSGIYFYKLTRENKKPIIKKMLMLK